MEAVSSSFCLSALRRRAFLLFAKSDHEEVDALAHNSNRLESTSTRTGCRVSDENDRNSERRGAQREHADVRRPPRNRHARPSSREERPSPAGCAARRADATAEPSKTWPRSRYGPSFFAGCLSLTGLAASFSGDLAALCKDGEKVGARGTPTSAVESKTSWYSVNFSLRHGSASKLFLGEPRQTPPAYISELSTTAFVANAPASLSL